MCNLTYHFRRDCANNHVLGRRGGVERIVDHVVVTYVLGLPVELASFEKHRDQIGLWHFSVLVGKAE